MALGARGFLNFSRLGTLRYGEAVGTKNGTAALPTIANDPTDSAKGALELIATGQSTTAGDHTSVQTFTLATAMTEFWCEFPAYYNHPAAAGDGTFVIARFLNSAGAEWGRLSRISDTVTQFNTAGGTVALSTDLGKAAFGIFRIRIKGETTPGTSSDGIVEIDLNGSEVSNVTNLSHADLTNIKTIIFCSRPSGTLGNTAGTKSVYVRYFAWGSVEAHAVPPHFGMHMLDYSCGSSTITQRARTWYDHRRYGVTASVTIRFDYKLASEPVTWTTGSAVSLTADAFGDYVKIHDYTGLTPGTQYNYRSVITDGGSLNITTETCTTTTPLGTSATSGTTNMCVMSCNSQYAVGADTNPKTTAWQYIQSNGTHGNIWIGDIWYADAEIPGDATDELWMREAMRLNLYYDYDANQCCMNTPMFFLPDDHDYGVDNAKPADPLADPSALVLYGYATDQFTTYWGTPLGGFHSGSYAQTVNTGQLRLVFGDTRAEKESATTIMSSTQRDAIKAQFINCPATTVFLVQGPCLDAWGEIAANDSYNWNMTEFLSYLQYFADHNDTSHKMLIVYGDRHTGGSFATEWSRNYGGRIGYAVNVSPFMRQQNAHTDLEAQGAEVAWLDSVHAAPDNISRILKLSHNHATNVLTQTMVDGEDGSTLHSEAMEAGVGTLGPTLLKDAHVSNSTPTENYGANAIMVLSTNAGGTITRRMFFDFGSISSIPAGSTIDSAILTLVCSTVTTASAQAIQCRRVTRQIVEGTGDTGTPGVDGITWNKYDGTNDWTLAGGDFGTTNDAIGTSPTTTGTYEYDCKNCTQEALDAGAPLILCIKRTAEANGTASNVSYDSDEGTGPPNMVITYTEASGAAGKLFIPIIFD